MTPTFKALTPAGEWVEGKSKTKNMSDTRIKIKELEMNAETAIRIGECLKKHEPEIWKVLSRELKQALHQPTVSCLVPSDVLDLLKTIAGSDERIYREKAKALIGKYCR